MDFENTIKAIRENDRTAFAEELNKVDLTTDLARPNSTPLANWFSGIGATLLQLTAFVRPPFAAKVLEKGATMDLYSACALGDVHSIMRLLAEDPNAIDQPSIHIFRFNLHYGIRRRCERCSNTATIQIARSRNKRGLAIVVVPANRVKTVVIQHDPNELPSMLE